MSTGLSGVEDDDRDGVGCFLKENRTLWVGGVPVFDEASARESVRQNFGAWGRISSVRLVKNKVQRLVLVLFLPYRATGKQKETMTSGDVECPCCRVRFYMARRLLRSFSEGGGGVVMLVV